MGWCVDKQAYRLRGDPRPNDLSERATRSIRPSIPSRWLGARAAISLD